MATVKYFQLNDTKDKNNISVRNVIFSIVTAYFALIIGMLVLSALVVYGPLGAETAEKIVNVLYYVSCVVCGFLASVSQRKKGWFNGLIATLCYYGVVVISVISVSAPSFGLDFIIKMLLSVILGMIGGIAGVNKKKKKR